MKKIKIAYWIFTALFAFMMAGSAIPNIMMDEMSVQGMHTELGYPKYFIPFIGVAKLLGVIAILVPGFPKIREWAYAGLFFDLIGATYSIMMIGKSAENWVFMVIPFGLGIGSYILNNKLARTRASGEHNFVDNAGLAIS
ncbi:MAG: DoxX family protein [Chitinophagaceae bacterium]|nr:MAG: DoxX family protein [Chitinophagaceae bacterium]